MVYLSIQYVVYLSIQCGLLEHTVCGLLEHTVCGVLEHTVCGALEYTLCGALEYTVCGVLEHIFSALLAHTVGCSAFVSYIVYSFVNLFINVVYLLFEHDSQKGTMVIFVYLWLAIKLVYKAQRWFYRFRLTVYSLFYVVTTHTWIICTHKS